MLIAKAICHSKGMPLVRLVFVKPKAGPQRLLPPGLCGYRSQRAAVLLVVEQPELSSSAWAVLFCLSCSALAVDCELFSLNVDLLARTGNWTIALTVMSAPSRMVCPSKMVSPSRMVAR